MTTNEHLDNPWLRPFGVAVLAATLGWACRPVEKTHAPQSDPEDPKTVAAVDATRISPNERLLYLPEGDPASLLGREVTQDAQGHTVIADALRPGCRAEVTEVPNAYSRDYDRALSDAAGMRASVRQIAELEGHYARGLRLQLSIDNVSVLRAKLVGECGDEVITEVDVGSGERRIVTTARGGGSVAVDLGIVGGAGASGSSGRSESEALQWQTPQAWAFRTTDGQAGRARISILMPERVSPGTQWSPRLRVDEPLWLVVLFRDAQGHHGVLLPRGRHAEVQADGELTLPALVAENLPGNEQDRETLLVYGFTERADFELFRPPAGAIATQQADAYAQNLKTRLDAGEIPPARWAASEFRYVIAADAPGG